jgi:hypothetical protein
MQNRRHASIAAIVVLAVSAGVPPALAAQLAPLELDHVFSTEYNRTWSTALPVAHAAGLEVEAYNPRDLAGFAAQLHTLRGRIVVVGHSNTTPMLVEALGG